MTLKQCWIGVFIFIKSSWLIAGDTTTVMLLRDENHALIIDTAIITINGKYYGTYDMRDSVFVDCITFKKPFEVSFIPLNSGFSPAFLKILSCDKLYYEVLFYPTNRLFSTPKKSKKKSFCPIE